MIFSCDTFPQKLFISLHKFPFPSFQSQTFSVDSIFYFFALIESEESEPAGTLHNLQILQHFTFLVANLPYPLEKHFFHAFSVRNFSEQNNLICLFFIFYFLFSTHFRLFAWLIKHFEIFCYVFYF